MLFLLFDVLPAGHRVPHAGAREPLNVLHDDEGFLLQRDDGQVAVVQLGVAEGVEARPHWVFKRKAAVVQFPHLEGTTEKEVTRRRGGASRGGDIFHRGHPENFWKVVRSFGSRRRMSDRLAASAAGHHLLLRNSDGGFAKTAAEEKNH